MLKSSQALFFCGHSVSSYRSLETGAQTEVKVEQLFTGGYAGLKGTR